MIQAHFQLNFIPGTGWRLKCGDEQSEVNGDDIKKFLSDLKTNKIAVLGHVEVDGVGSQRTRLIDYIEMIVESAKLN